MFERFRAALLGSALALAAPLAAAETHALIMTISNYEIPGVPPLKGVAQDAGNARLIAQRLGVKEQNMTLLRDRELTYAGMNAAFDRLLERIAPDDNVFIYYSGHGGRQLLRDPEPRCAESLITVQGEAFVDAELEVKLKLLSRKANKLVVFLDACHSGGVTTRAASTRFMPKYFSRAGGDACERPVNVLKRGITAGTRSVGSGAQNYVYIAAARDNEVSLDEPGKGGVATQAWTECVTGAARDLDGSGGLSAEEVQACAQEIIDRKLRNVPGFAPHHISITGNTRAVLAFTERTTSSAPASVAVSPVDTLKDIFAQRDDRRLVTLSPRDARVRIGRDKVELSVSSSHAGYVYLLMVGSDGKTFDMLFPNQLDRANQIEAGQTLRLPRPNWEVMAGGPPGTTRLLAIVADAPRDFSRLQMKPAGPFSMVEANAVSSKDIQLVSTSSSTASSDECADPVARRNFAVARRCSNAYGAALIAVEEMP
jgi:caspase domain-containing protein/uncharacterized protein DUF4384